MFFFFVFFFCISHKVVLRHLQLCRMCALNLRSQFKKNSKSKLKVVVERQKLLLIVVDECFKL